MGLFDWFRTRQSQEQPDSEWWERLAQVESDMKQLQLEWENTFGKVRRALAALAKRQERGEEEESPSSSSSSNGESDYAAARRLGLFGRRTN